MSLIKTIFCVHCIMAHPQLIFIKAKVEVKAGVLYFFLFFFSFFTNLSLCAQSLLLSPKLISSR